MQENTQQQGNSHDVANALTVRGKAVRPWLALTALVFGLFMAMLDATVVNVALPTIQHGLKTDLSTASWVLNAYNLGFAVLLVTVGRFADQYGRKRTFLLGMILFSLGSLFCGLAPALSSISGWPAISWLIAARALQAVGAAGLTPISLAIIMAIFPPLKRGPALGIWGALAGLASASGPVLGGFLIQIFDWPSIFYLNLPFCLLGLVLVYLFVPETHNTAASKRVDLPGVLTLTAALLCLVLAIIEGNEWGWTSLPILGLFGAALFGLVLFGIVEYFQRNGEPMVDFALFKLVSFSGSNATALFFCIAVQGAFLLVGLYYLNALNYSQLMTAYALLPVPLGSVVVAPFTSRLSHKIHPGLLGITGMLLSTCGFVLLATIKVDVSFWDIIWRCALIGIAQGLIFQTLPAASLSEVPPSRFGVGSGVFSTFRQVGVTLGIALLVSVFTAFNTIGIKHATSTAIAQVQSESTLPLQIRKEIVKELKQTSSDKANSSNSSPNFDLNTLSRQLPPTTSESLRLQISTRLQMLNAQLHNEFKAELTSAFQATWWLAAGFSLAGIFSTLLMYFARQRTNTEAAPLSSEEISASVPGD